MKACPEGKLRKVISEPKTQTRAWPKRRNGLSVSKPYLALCKIIFPNAMAKIKRKKFFGEMLSAIVTSIKIHNPSASEVSVRKNQLATDEFFVQLP